MPYRSTQEKREAQEAARSLYVKDGLSLAEISRQTGETLKTLRAWRNLGEWDTMREKNTRTELDRLNSVRDRLLDKVEAQLEAGKLPHTEIGLLYKAERMIAQRRRRMMDMAPEIVLYTIKYLKDYLRDHDPKLLQAFTAHIQKFGAFVQKQDFTGPLK